MSTLLAMNRSSRPAKSAGRVSACLFLFAALAGIFGAALTTSAMTLEELAEQFRSAPAIESYQADIGMTMSLQGVTVSFTGSVMGEGERARTTMNMDMLGQTGVVTSVVDKDGIAWTDTNMGGQRMVMKFRTEDMMEFAESASGMPFMDMMQGNSMTAYQDPAKLLESLQQMFELDVQGEGMEDGVPVYILNATMKDEFKELADALTAAAGPDFSMERARFVFGKDGFMRKYAMLRSDGEPFMEMTYSNVELNIDIPHDTFVYTPPEGVEVMDMSDLAALTGSASGMDNGKFQVGQQAPDFSGPGLDGKTIKLSDYSGKVVLIDFWATWCGPCVAELPNVLSAYEKYHPRGFEIVGISLDETESDLTDFLAERSTMTWPQIYDGKGWESDVASQYGVNAIPHTLLLDGTGTIRYKDLRGDALAGAIETLLTEAGR